MESRDPCFARDIKPLFRESDREEMLDYFDLWKCADVQTYADAILARLRKGDMPCDGKWPEARIALFAQWTATGKACECTDAETVEPAVEQAAAPLGEEAAEGEDVNEGFAPYWDVPSGKGIKDMFTARDIGCMSSRNVFLEDYANVARHSNIIYGFVKTGRMPPGPNKWRPSRLDVFLTWKDNGCPERR